MSEVTLKNDQLFELEYIDVNSNFLLICIFFLFTAIKETVDWFEANYDIARK